MYKIYNIIIDFNVVLIMFLNPPLYSIPHTLVIPLLPNHLYVIYTI